MVGTLEYSKGAKMKLVVVEQCGKHVIQAATSIEA
jgi:hypothetical protein